ncbi:MAG: RNA-guided pseudouridylation complex pseudouridine synthase subunit Cbf5 [Candidatus Hydrothermarchaeota archaeon]
MIPKRNILIKFESETDLRWGTPPNKRSLDEYIKKGIINLDKPKGPTSHEVVSWVKEILAVERAGHGGTLDPKVSGVLPITIEKATKLVQVLLPSVKEYVGVLRLHGRISDENLMRVFREFVGTVYQKPPVKSAIKREVRTREIYHLDIQEKDGSYILFKVSCQAGTYIRKLCHDIGEALGVGAHMAELRRTRTGPFTEENSVTLHDLKDAYQLWKEEGIEKYLRETVMPMEYAVSHLPKVYVKDSAVSAICHGASLTVPGIPMLDKNIERGKEVALMTLKGELIALGISEMSAKEIMESDKGIAVNVKRVFMEPEVYPRIWKRK